MTKYTQKQFKTASTLLKKMSVRAVGKKMGISKSVIGRWKKTPLIEIKKYKPVIEYTTEHIKAARGLDKITNKSVKEISEFMNISPPTIRKWLKEPDYWNTQYEVREFSNKFPELDEKALEQALKLKHKIHEGIKEKPKKYANIWFEVEDGKYEVMSG